MNAISHERDQFYKLIDTLKALQEQHLHDSQTSYSNAQISVNKSYYFIIVSFLLIGIIGFLFDFSIVRKIVNSVEKVQIGLEHFFLYLS